MKRIWEWVQEWWLAVIGVVSILLLGAFMVWVLFIHKPLTEGYVTGKDYTPAHNSYAPIHMNVNGTTQIIPHWNYYPDKWKLTIQNGEDTDWWYVSESYYDSVKIGEWVTK